MTKHRIIAINLPQFHPFKENDEWWGKGFTEWTNVTKAKPRFEGHYQPQLPTETGFYDLRLPEARRMQAEMAKEAGIYGFCYYHYWFNGHQLMERPVNEILESKDPDFPFMLCWANENWARNWDGGFHNVLMEQKYSEQDDIDHMKWLCERVFIDERYIKIGGKPVFVLYNPLNNPILKTTIKTWRSVAKEYGFELYLCFMRGEEPQRKEILNCGFDAAIDFQPHFSTKTEYITNYNKWQWKLIHLKDFFHIKTNLKIEGEAKDYKEYIEEQIPNLNKTYKEFPGITPGWDNSSRRVDRRFWMLKNNTPSLYGFWLSKIIEKFRPYNEEENLIFVNAWNEWAEGNHLEPDIKWGRGFLEETKKRIH